MSTTPPNPLDPLAQEVETRLEQDALAESQQVDTITQLQQHNLDLKLQLAKSVPKLLRTRLERNTWLIAPGAAGNTGSVGSLANEVFTPATDKYPTLQLQPLGPYANKYMYQTLGADDTIVSFDQRVSILFPAASDAANSQAFELDLPQSIASGLWFNWGLQLDFAQNMLRVWNKSAGAWVAIPGVPMPRLTAQKWVDLQVLGHRSGNSVIYDAVEINGQNKLASPTTFSAVQLNKAPLINFGLQEDGEGTKPQGPAYTVALSDCELRGYTA